MQRILDRLDRRGRSLLECDDSWQPPLLMGIVNVTPDSFYDGGRYEGVERAVAHAMRLLEEGADILDIGGESTRPPGRDYGAGASAVDQGEEQERVLPVIERIRQLRPDAVISIDTVKAVVAREAAERGAAIINDVSGGSDPAMVATAAERGLPLVLMHGHDPAHPRSVDEVEYRDVVEEVYRDLAGRVERAREGGVVRVIADVGLGFGKRAGHSIDLLRAHGRFLDLGVPLLVGASRKGFIGRVLGGLPPEERLIGSITTHAVAALRGAAILRAHDVKETRQMLDLLAALVGGERMDEG